MAFTAGIRIHVYKLAIAGGNTGLGSQYPRAAYPQTRKAVVDHRCGIPSCRDIWTMAAEVPLAILHMVP